MHLPSSFWKTAGVLFGLIALLKGLRRPNPWALTQLQISYTAGFVKRGLLGECLKLCHLRSQRAVESFCFLELAVLVFLLVLLTRQSGLFHADHSPMLACAVCGSYALTFVAHLNGYLDITLYGLAAAVLLVRRPGPRLALAVPVCFGCMLIHENFLFTALPPLLLSFLLDAQRVGRARRGVVSAAALLGMCVALAATISSKGYLSGPELARFKATTEAQSAYPVQDVVLDIVGLSTRANLQQNWLIISHEYWWWAELGVALATCGPLLWMLLGAMTRNESARSLRVALYAASLAPLLLNGIGWDNVRWVALAVLSSFLNLCLLSRGLPTGVVYRVGAREYQYALLVLGLGLASGNGLMDHRSINPYPFFPRYLHNRVVAHDGPLGEIL